MTALSGEGEKSEEWRRQQDSRVPLSILKERDGGGSCCSWMPHRCREGAGVGERKKNQVHITGETPRKADDDPFARLLCYRLEGWGSPLQIVVTFCPAVAIPWQFLLSHLSRTSLTHLPRGTPRWQLCSRFMPSTKPRMKGHLTTTTTKNDS